MKQNSDKETLRTIVENMANAQTGDEITKDWHENATWYDLQFLQEKGLKKIRDVFNQQFSIIKNIQTKLLDVEVFVDGSVGFVYSIQHFQCDDLNGNKVSDIITRQTDCFTKQADEWKLIHQHVSLPANFETGEAIFKSKI